MTLGQKSNNIRTTSYWNLVHSAACFFIFQDLLKISSKSWVCMTYSILQNYCTILNYLSPLCDHDRPAKIFISAAPRGPWHDQNFSRPVQNLELLDIQSLSKNLKQIMTFFTLSSGSYCDTWHVQYFNTHQIPTVMPDSPITWNCTVCGLLLWEILNIFQMRLVCITGHWPVHQ
jgi:hypothetical protein